jgi:hypothetical protein
MGGTDLKEKTKAGKYRAPVSTKPGTKQYNKYCKW